MRSFENLKNIRDLGGIKTANGRIVRSGRLIRGGEMVQASEKDLQTLSEAVELIVDFRNEEERAEKPDPPVAGAAYCAIPILASKTAGVSRDEESEELAARMLSDPEAARKYMIHAYEGIAADPYCVEQYGKFVRLLLEKRKKAVLWHCSAGKDRTGCATAIVLELLGADRETITVNYLQSNDCLKEDTEQLVRLVLAQMKKEEDETCAAALSYLFSVHEECLNAYYKKINALYGSFEAFIRQGLKISPQEQAQLKAIYLEERKTRTENKTHLYDPKHCPCLRGQQGICPRYLDCEACVAFHRSKGENSLTACERMAREAADSRK